MYNDDMDGQGILTATLTIRNFDSALKERLRVRAAQHGHPMEAELRDILQETSKEAEPSAEPHLYDRIRARFVPLGGAETDYSSREARRKSIIAALTSGARARYGRMLDHLILSSARLLRAADPVRHQCRTIS